MMGRRGPAANRCKFCESRIKQVSLSREAIAEEPKYERSNTQAPNYNISQTLSCDLIFVKKRIQQYVTHYEESEWEDDTYPTVIFFVPNEKLKKKSDRYIKGYLYDRFMDDDELIIQASTFETFEIDIKQ